MAQYVQTYDQLGRFSGVRRDDGANIPADPGNRDWRDFLDWNAAQPDPLGLADLAGPKKPKRPPAEQRDAILLDLITQRVQAEPGYLVRPTFDPTINVPGE